MSGETADQNAAVAPQNGPGEDQQAMVNDSGAEAQMSVLVQLKANPPPDPLPPGWVMRRSRADPSCCYYYNQDTGVCRWEPPRLAVAGPSDGGAAAAGGQPQQAAAAAGAAAAEPAVRSILKRSAQSGDAGGQAADATKQPDAAAAAATSPAAPSPKKRKTDEGEASSSSRPEAARGSPGSPEQVRVLHLLKKHRGSRRPASWRNPKITDSKEKAISDLKELISILKESEGDPKELRATFEELARTESDCSSAKRGGDLGFFGRRKMQPAFEKASFGLKVGQLSGIVETSSGVHVILRLA